MYRDYGFNQHTQIREEVDTLVLSEEAQRFALLRRQRPLLAAYAELALDRATDPNQNATTKGKRDAAFAAVLYEETQILLGRYDAALTSAPSETDEAEVAETGPDEPDPWKCLSGERLELAHETRDAMAKKFEIHPDHLTLIRVLNAAKPEDEFIIIHSAPGGMNFNDLNPSWCATYNNSLNSIIREDRADEFTIEVGGQKLDTRLGLTENAYKAFIEDAKRREVEPLPDSEMIKLNGEDWPRVRILLTAERDFPVNQLVMFVKNGKPDQHTLDRSKHFPDVRIRLAAKVPLKKQSP